MSTFDAWIQNTLGFSPELRERLLESLAIILLLWLVRRLILVGVWRRQEDVGVRYRWRKVSLWAAVTLGFVIVGGMWVRGLRDISTFLGILSAGFAIALKDIIVNLAGWVFIVWRRPFQVGDRIEIGEYAGDVIDLRIFQFTLLEIGNWVNADQSTGRIMHVPNGLVLSVPLANYSRGFKYIWNELAVLVTFESDWAKAKKLLTEIVRKHSRAVSEEAARGVRDAAEKFLIFYNNLESKIYTSVEESGVLLTMRYLCDPKKRRGSAELIWEEILTVFATCEDIDFAYPTQRFYNNVVEGKEKARAASLP